MNPTSLKKAVIYCRVSTKEQVEEGNSLVTQEKHCREFAIKNGYEVAQVFIEQGESAKTADRTELKKLLGFCALKRNNIQAIIAYKIDRISRNIDDYSQIRIQLRRYGVEIKSTSEPFEDTPAGRFMENIIANVAQFDNDVRAERCIGGMRDAMREGRYVWRAPYGYTNTKVNGKANIIITEGASLIKQAFEKVAQNNYPIEQIRRDMFANGMTNKSGSGFAKSYFSALLKNRVYIGLICKFGEIHRGNFESVITEELFNKVQWVLASRKRSTSQYLIQRPEFPLRRFISHPNGKMLTGYWAQGRSDKYPYYRFHKANLNIRKDQLEMSFKKILNQFRIDNSYFEKILILVKKNLQNHLSLQKSHKEKIISRIAEHKLKQQKILEKNIEGIISNEFCKENIQAIENDVFLLNQKIINSQKLTVDYPYLLEIIRGTLNSPGETWERLSGCAKIKLQWFYFPDGIIFDGKQSRTKKICSILKLKREISTCTSSKVHRRDSKSNTDNIQIILPSDKSDILNEEFWEDIGKEIVTLSEIVSGKPTDPSEPVSTLSYVRETG